MTCEGSWQELATSRGLLVAMLLVRGQAEERQGYGHATAEDVADTVMEWLELVARQENA
jgi:hypothetical protein